MERRHLGRLIFCITVRSCPGMDSILRLTRLKKSGGLFPRPGHGLWRPHSLLRTRHGTCAGARPRKQYLLSRARNQDQIVEAINGCDLGIIPNHRNIFTEINTPTRIFEYLALGKPVIAPKAPGIQDYLANATSSFSNWEMPRTSRRIEFAFAYPNDALETGATRTGNLSRPYLEPRERAAAGGDQRPVLVALSICANDQRCRSALGSSCRKRSFSSSSRPLGECIARVSRMKFALC